MTRFNFVCCFIAAIFLLGTAYAKPVVKTDYTIVPLIFKSWYPSVLVTIQGVQIPLQFDLGAGNTELSLNPALIKKYKILVKYTGKVRRVSDTVGRKATLKEFILPTIQLSNLKISPIKGVENNPFPWGSPGNPPPYAKNGVIGVSLAAKFNVIIDYKNAKLILIKGNGYPPGYDVSQWQQFPFIMTGNVITAAKLGNKKINLLWDTGSQYNLIRPSTIKANKIKNCSQATASDIAVNANDCHKITATLTIGKHRFKNMTFYITPMKGLPADGIIGASFFESHTVYINFSRRIMAVKLDP